MAFSPNLNPPYKMLSFKEGKKSCVRGPDIYKHTGHFSSKCHCSINQSAVIMSLIESSCQSELSPPESKERDMLSLHIMTTPN